MPKVKCEDCVHVFLTLSEIMPDAFCGNDETNICAESPTWNRKRSVQQKAKILQRLCGIELE